MHKKLLYILLTFFLPYFSAHSVSFNCNGKLTLVENAICTNPELSFSDGKLSQLYKELLKGALKEKIKSTQIKWLKEKRNKCKSVDCLKAVYAERLRELEKGSSEEQKSNKNHQNEIQTVLVIGKVGYGTLDSAIEPENEAGESLIFMTKSDIGKTIFQTCEEDSICRVKAKVTKTNYGYMAQEILEVKRVK